MVYRNGGGSEYSVESSEEPYYCAPTYKPSDIICPGSDTEETPEETAAKRQRYEDAARRYKAGERPRILSAGLKGPFDATSGWINPWRHRARGPKGEDWWQPGSDNMLFTRENVMTRAAAYGLGYMTPKEALAWCKASAQDQLDSQLEGSRQERLIKSVEQVNSEEMDSGDEEEEVELMDDIVDDEEDSRIQRLSMANNYATTPFTDEDSTRGIKRPINTNWLKGSYISKRAKWDGPDLPSPTPATSLNYPKEKRRQPLKTQRATSNMIQRPVPSPGFERIQRPRHLSMTQLPHSDRVANNKQQKAPSRRSEGRHPRHDQSTASQHRQVDGMDEYHDELQEFAPSSFSSQSSRPRSRGSTKDLADFGMSDLEPDELATTPYDSPRTKNKGNSTLIFSANSIKLPSLPQTLSSDRGRHVDFEDEDSFVTEVAPSSQDLEKFMFRKKRKISARELPTSSNQKLSKSNPSSVKVKLLTTTRLSSMQSASSPISNHSMSESEESDIAAKARRSQSSFKDETVATEVLFGDIKKLISSDSVKRVKSLPLSFTSKNLPEEKKQRLGRILKERNSFLIHSSHIIQPKTRHSFKRLPNIEPILRPTIETSPQSPAADIQSHVVSEETMLEPHEQLLAEQGLDAAKMPNNALSQDPSDFSTQSFNTTPTCSRRSPSKPLPSNKKSSKISRLKRFSFENALGGLLFSPMSASLNDIPTTSKVTAPLERQEETRGKHEGTPAQTGFDDYQAYIKGSIIDEIGGRPDDIHSEEPTSDASPRHSIAAGREEDGNVIDQIDKAPSQKASITSPDSHARSPSCLRSIRRSPIEAPRPAPLSPGAISVGEGEGSSGSDQDLHQSSISNTLADGFIDEIVHKNSQENGLENEKPVTSSHHTASPKPVKESEDSEEVNHPIDLSDMYNDESEQASTPRVPVAQSPFATELFIVEKSILEPDATHAPAPVIDADSDTSWERGVPQSPWAIGASDNLITLPSIILTEHAPLQHSPQDPDLAFSTVLQGVVLKKQGGVTNENSHQRTDDEDDFSIRPFRDLMSPSPSPVRRRSAPQRIPTDTQQLVNDTLQNPWASSLKKSIARKSHKRVSFDNVPLQANNEDGDDRIPPGSPPPQDDDLLNEVIFGAGFTRAMPFSNHFKVARRFSHILPDGTKSPSKSSPPLSAQAEAFIAADMEGQAKRLHKAPSEESPTRHLQARSDTDENSHWNDWQDERSARQSASPKRSHHKQQSFSTNMTNFDMDEALNQMGDFLEDWSVEAELKKVQEPSSHKE